jgi:hypothetical protein
MPENSLGSDIRVYTECPSDRFPKDVEKPKIELFSFRLSFSDGEPSQEQINTALLFGVKNELDRQQLCIQTIRSYMTEIDLDGAMTMGCPKLPKDIDARIGVKRHPIYPDKKEKIFGYNAIISASVEPPSGYRTTRSGQQHCRKCRRRKLSGDQQRTDHGASWLQNGRRSCRFKIRHHQQL